MPIKDEEVSKDYMKIYEKEQMLLCQGRDEGREGMAIELVRDGELSVEAAAAKLNITKEQLREKIGIHQEGYVASNAYSLAQAWLYRDANDVYPFAMYNDDEPVGFMLLDEDLEERCLVIWRIMFPVEHQNKGFGTQAIGKIVQMAKESGKYDYMIIDYVPENKTAGHVYEKIGFRPTGEISNGEIVMRLDFV